MSGFSDMGIAQRATAPPQHPAESRRETLASFAPSRFPFGFSTNPKILSTPQASAKLRKPLSTLKNIAKETWPTYSANSLQ
jgi:hypothetical protein